MTQLHSLPGVMHAAPSRVSLDPSTLTDPTTAEVCLVRSSNLPVDMLPDRYVHATGIQPHPDTGPFWARDVCGLLAGFAADEFSPGDLISALKSRISATTTGREAVLRAVEGADDAVLDSTARWRNGTARPLEGIPFGVKDIIDVGGTMVTSGSHLTGERIAQTDAAVVAALRAAGAIPFVMTATTEFATGSPFNPRFGVVTNPHDRCRWTGGSSTGSGATLADRLLPFCLGTDTGGSIRVPSAWCGTTGLKPTRELVSRAGIAPLSWTLDHAGPMTRSARDIAAVLPFMTARPDAALFERCHALLAGPTATDPRGLRIGVPSNWFMENVDRAVLDNWQAALMLFEDAGAVVVALPPLPFADYHAAGWVILMSELATLHRPQLDRAALFDKGLMIRLEKGLTFSAADYGAALQQRAVAQRDILRAMGNVDVMLTPGVGGEAGHLATLAVDVDGQPHAFQDIISRNTMVFDLTGFPALMLPSGRGRAGLPTAIQIIARPHDDVACLTLGIAFQTMTAHHAMMPPPGRADAP